MNSFSDKASAVQTTSLHFLINGSPLKWRLYILVQDS